MKTLVLLSTGLVLILAQNSKLLQDFIAGNQRFAANIYKEALKTTKGNFLINPLSLQMILSLALMEATEEGFAEISSALELPIRDDEETKQLFKQIISNMDKTGESTLATANKILVKKGLHIKDDLKVVAINNYNSEIEHVNFLDKSAISKINNWVTQNTFDKTTMMVSENSFSEKTNTVLVNLQYFKGFWQKGFSSRSTKPRTFYINETAKAEIDLMELSTNFKYAYNDTLRAQFIELPYYDSDMSMTIVLPDDIFGLPRLEARIEEIFYDQIYYGPKVRLIMPTFSIKSTVLLDTALKNLGIKHAFSDNGDADGIGFKISNAYQKAIIDVNEDGRAVVARRGKIQGTAPWVEILIDFIADHPFLFYLKSQSAGVFFIGRYIAP
ncbi:hypothetical protein RI129_010572 [Pyrocoelia pectoralis]|uniref:Serpin domain-containing protein n=1 Tax=Pyrocoelia pectoralis TaxID=417401 RepID=A0AAN7V6G8_9COLE